MGSIFYDDPLFDRMGIERQPEHKSAYRLVSFVSPDGSASVDRLLKMRFENLGYLPENIPLSDIFVPKQSSWPRILLEEVVERIPSFSVEISDQAPIKPRLRSYYPLQNSFSISALDYVIRARLYANNQSDIGPNVESVYPSKIDQLKISTCRDYDAGQVFDVDNVSLVRLASEQDCSRAEIVDFFTLGPKLWD